MEAIRFFLSSIKNPASSILFQGESVSVRIISDKCECCESCVTACPFGAIEMRDGKAFITEACTMCGACVEVCEFKAIERTEEATGPAADLSAYKGVWIFA